MSEQATIRCDGPHCTHVKGETNHWWKLYISLRPFVVIVQAFDVDENPPTTEYRLRRYDICGEACLQKTISDAIERSKTP